MPTPAPPHTKGVLCGMLTAISYGTNPLFALPMLAAGIGVNSILFYRYFFAAALYGAFLLIIKKRSLRLRWREGATLLILALLFSFSSIALFSSFEYIDAGISCTLLFVYPSLVALLSALFYGEKLSRDIVVAIIASGAGVALLARGDSELQPQAGLGICYALISALLYALYIVGVRHAKHLRRVRSDKLNFYIMLFGFLIYVINLDFCTKLQGLPSPFLWGCALLLALIPTIFSLETLTLAIKLIGPTRAAILGALEPLTAMVIGIALFGEQLSGRIAAGFALIIAGVLVVVARKQPAKK